MNEEIFSELNDFQLEAVKDFSKACLVNANVGSGKTTVLIAKIYYLHKYKNIPLDKMIVLTFTNKAANEIKERMESLDGFLSKEDMRFFGTFHSVALKLLKTELPVSEIGYTSDFTVIDPAEELEIAQNITVDNNLNIKYQNRLQKRIELAKRGKVLYSNMRSNDDIMLLADLLKIEKIKQDKMSFDDLISNIVCLLKKVEFKSDYIIVDEFQDCDSRQMEFIHFLTDDKSRIFVVGDPNQIIYSWRGSNLNVFDEFKVQYEAVEYSLPINYRSCESILEVARLFLNQSTDLDGIREHGSKIIIKQHYNPFNEAIYLSERVKELIQKSHCYKDIAIFYRKQSQSKALEDVFKKENIPYEVSLKRTLGDVPVLRWFTRLLKYSVNPNDKNSGLFVLSHDIFGDCLQTKEAKKIINGSESEGTDLFHKMLMFKVWCSEKGAISDVYDFFDIDNYINPTTSHFQENKSYIQALLNSMGKYIESRDGTFLERLTDFINSSALYGLDVLINDMDPDSNTVKLMTLHASKGLEFKHVFIVGANDGLLPLHLSSEEEREEERRLFFVGVTRATDFLEVSYYTSPDDMRAFPGAGEFISMIPEHLTECDEMQTSSTGLQSFRREIAELKRQKNLEIEFDNKPDSDDKRISHKKYGIGVVVNENEETVVAVFENYGEKELLKAFQEFEIV